MENRSVVDQATRPEGARKRWECPECHAALKKIHSKKREKDYWLCPEETGCGKWYSDANGEPVLRPVSRGEPVEGVECPECRSPMTWVTGAKYGPFWSCSQHQETGCQGTRDCLDPESGADPVNITPDCPSDPRHGPMKRRNGSNGVFLGCKKYPECETTMELSDALVGDEGGD